jgi:hypothetical protein
VSFSIYVKCLPKLPRNWADSGLPLWSLCRIEQRTVLSTQLSTESVESAAEAVFIRQKEEDFRQGFGRYG